MTLLYIDDDLDDRLIFREAVSQLGISVELIEAGDGDAGMKVLESTIPAFIFLDINMPRTSGKEVLLKVRGDDRFSRVHISMFSTAITYDDEAFFLRSGANKCIRKPDSFKSLCKIILDVVTTQTHCEMRN